MNQEQSFKLNIYRQVKKIIPICYLTLGIPAIISALYLFFNYLNMNNIVIKPFNLIDQTHLPEMTVDHILTDGDPLEIKGEMYYVCENINEHPFNSPVVGVIPLVVRNPAKINNINSYIKCLSLAHRKVQFKNEKGLCDFDNCDEMVIS